MWFDGTSPCQRTILVWWHGNLLIILSIFSLLQAVEVAVKTGEYKWDRHHECLGHRVTEWKHVGCFDRSGQSVWGKSRSHFCFLLLQTKPSGKINLFFQWQEFPVIEDIIILLYFPSFLGWMSVSHVTVRWGTEGCFHELGSRAFENKIVMQSCLLQEVYFPPFPVIVSHTLRLGGTPARTSVAPGQVFFVEAISWGGSSQVPSDSCGQRISRRKVGWKKFRQTWSSPLGQQF